MIAADLRALDRAALLELLCTGHPIDPHALDDREYHGVSLGLPHFVEQLTWKKFKKVFRRDPASGSLRGWNVRVEQNELDGPFVDRRGPDGAPLTFGPYEVIEARGVRMPAPADRGLLIDYGRGKNPPLLRRLRDPIVALNPGDPTLLLGWTYVDLGLSRFGTPSFFTLESGGALGYDR